MTTPPGWGTMEPTGQAFSAADPSVELDVGPDGGLRALLRGDSSLRVSYPRVMQIFSEMRDGIADSHEYGTFPLHYRKLGDVAAKVRANHHVAEDMPLVRWVFSRAQAQNTYQLEPQTAFELAFDIALADHWRTAGRPRLVLTESLAAVMSLTRSPPLLWDWLPWRAFMIEVPRRFLPIAGPPNLPAWIIAGKVDRCGMMVDGCNPFVSHARAYQMTATGEAIADRSADPENAKLAIRILSNVVAFVTRHRECMTPRARPRARDASTSDDVFDVRPPADLVVTRVLRDHAAELVAAKTVDGAKRVLRHVVRGHWKHQVAGAGRTERKLIFVAPYVRGDEKLGHVVDKILKLEEG